MKRREAIKNTALLMGGMISASTLNILVSACSSPDKGVRIGGGRDFTEEEKKMINRIADLIIPETDTPGALEARVPEFIVLMIQDTFPEEDQDKFHTGLKSFDEWCKEKRGRDFFNLPVEDQEKALRELDQIVLGRDIDESDDLSFYRVFKELTLLGFFTSETGATKTLRYVQIPGDYKGCMPYENGEKAWASTYYFQ